MIDDLNWGYILLGLLAPSFGVTLAVLTPYMVPNDEMIVSLPSSNLGGRL